METKRRVLEMTREEFLKRWSEIEEACETEVYGAKEVGNWLVHPKMFERLIEEFGKDAIKTSSGDSKRNRDF